MATTAKTKALNLGLTDAGAILLIFLVPALSHLTAVPFYLADPMRLAVLGALLVTRNWKNSLALAVALPLVSFAISGHPVFPKCLVIAAELSVNVLLFAWLAGRALKASSSAGLIGLAAFASILVSKLFYYGLKALVLSAGLLQMDLVATALWIQLIVALVISIAFGFLYKRN